MLIGAILYALSVGLIVYCTVTHSITAGVIALGAGFIAIVLSRPPRKVVA